MEIEVFAGLPTEIYIDYPKEVIRREMVKGYRDIALFRYAPGQLSVLNCC